MSVTLTLKQLAGIPLSNEELMVRFANTEDKRLLAQLYDNCADDVYHFIVAQSDAVLGKDICQKTWVKVIEKRHLYKASGSFKAWLFTMARNTLMDEYRTLNRASTQEYQDKNGPGEIVGVLSGDLEQAFDQALCMLPFEQREAFCLQQEGFGLQEIANITNENIETIKSRLRYAKNTLRKQLETYHVE